MTADDERKGSALPFRRLSRGGTKAIEDSALEAVPKGAITSEGTGGSPRAGEQAYWLRRMANRPRQRRDFHEWVRSHEHAAADRSCHDPGVPSNRLELHAAAIGVSKSADPFRNASAT
ncbi:MAG: hypothetical protein OXN89_06360 [Bryobacterales bacterium]|nr:hypothetical protein [Bryobacterales bacterium]